MKEMLGSQKGKERPKNDFYATYPPGVKILLMKENIRNKKILENSAGDGHIAKVLEDFGNEVYTIDLIQRKYPLDEVADFLSWNEDMYFDLAVYNPPFKDFIAFVKKTFQFTNKQWVLGRIQVLESYKRFNGLFRHGWLKKVLVFIGRMNCAKNGIDKNFGRNNSMVYAWFLFEKDYDGKPTIDWIDLKEADEK